MAGLSQQALADRLGVTRSAVSNWESASNVCPSTDKLAGVASLSNVCFEWLATGRGPTLLAENEADHGDASAQVNCPLELRLLQAYRRAPEPLKKVLHDLSVLRVVPFSRARIVRAAG